MGSRGSWSEGGWSPIRSECLYANRADGDGNQGQRVVNLDDDG